MNRDHKVSFRLDASLYALLMEICKELGQRPSEVIRDALLAYFLKFRNDRRT